LITVAHHQLVVALLLLQITVAHHQLVGLLVTAPLTYYIYGE
jgi:hypothetical protein